MSLIYPNRTYEWLVAVNFGAECNSQSICFNLPPRFLRPMSVQGLIESFGQRGWGGGGGEGGVARAIMKVS